MDQGGYDPSGLVVEVYDDAQPASRVDVPTIEVLAAGDSVVRPAVWMRNGPKDKVGLVHQIRPAQREMKTGAIVKHDHAAVRVGRPWGVFGHA